MVTRRAYALVLTVAMTISLGACFSYSSTSPTIVVPQGAKVICPSGAPATFYDNAYHC